MRRGRKPIPDQLKREIRRLKFLGISAPEISKRLFVRINKIKEVMAEYRYSYKHRNQSDRTRSRDGIVYLPEPMICPKCRHLVWFCPCVECKNSNSSR